MRQWADPVLSAARRLGPTPIAGSPAWQQLADTDPRKLASVLRAGLAWVSDATPTAIAHRLRADLDAQDRAVADRLKAASSELAVTYPWHTIGPTHRELCRRRAEPPRLPLPPFDPIAADRWVRTGHSGTPQEGSAAA